MPVTMQPAEIAVELPDPVEAEVETDENQFDEFLDLLKALIRQPSVVGAEHAFFRVLQRELEERGAKVTWYEGLLVAQGNNPDSCHFSSHIDRHGLICTGPNEFQFAAFVSGKRTDLLGTDVDQEIKLTLMNRFENTPVLAYEPWSGAYRGKGLIDNAYICEYRNNLIFEVEGLEHLVAGTPVGFSDKLKVEEGLLSGQLDNVLTAAMLVHLFSLGYQGTAFFTAEEECGGSWRYLLEWYRRFGKSTNQLYVLDTSPYRNREEADKQLVTLRNRDEHAEFHVETTQNLARLCQQLDISFGFKDHYIEQLNQQRVGSGQSRQPLGRTELGRICANANGLVHGTTLQIPTTGYHTMNETASIAASRAFLTLLRHIEINALNGP
ncbi:peptidase M42 [Thiomicrorhabdus sp. zzn3]|uniref:peptidase M42 n=1 Tax=Thiomicrorhabdus sp. zzn3 TaxID=3039775 RepID=UPI002436A4C3|nr:peptidase M42 [Thiomicrorhabdus sp. zzn3]MDG6778115.1 peptidase M42 [Thiomicrorhabdus sp. zzn3]